MEYAWGTREEYMKFAWNAYRANELILRNLPFVIMQNSRNNGVLFRAFHIDRAKISAPDKKLWYEIKIIPYNKSIKSIFCNEKQNLVLSYFRINHYNPTGFANRISKINIISITLIVI